MFVVRSVIYGFTFVTILYSVGKHNKTDLTKVQRQTKERVHSEILWRKFEIVYVLAVWEMLYHFFTPVKNNRRNILNWPPLKSLINACNET